MKLLTRISALLPLVITLIWLQFLPDQVPVNYDFEGNVDRWGSKWEYLLLPGIVLAMYMIACFVVKAGLRKSAEDGRQKAHAEANAKVIRVVLIVSGLFFTVLQSFMLYAAGQNAASGATVESVDLNRVTAVCMGVLFLVLGNYMPKAKRNSMVGFRCGWTMFNDVTWQKSNRFSGYALMLAGLATLACAVLLPENWVIPGMLVLLTTAMIICLVYAARVYHEEKAKG